MYSDQPRVRGTAWLDLGDAKEVTYRLDPGDDSARFTILGPVEVELDMPRDLVRHCRDVFAAAFTELSVNGSADRKPAS